MGQGKTEEPRPGGHRPGERVVFDKRIVGHPEHGCIAEDDARPVEAIPLDEVAGENNRVKFVAGHENQGGLVVQKLAIGDADF